MKAVDLDPGQARREAEHANSAAATHTVEITARQWLAKSAAERATSTQHKNIRWLERKIFPEIGAMPVCAIRPQHMLAALQKIAARGAVESAHKIKQLCGQVFRYAVACGLAERDMRSDLRGALCM
ncbi:hypothetical protein [Massilia sp. Root418]|uniref:tyrosine-type recombinase/integrase n=1 Tax=Massilia sp. Root418 TaxID=1736532 RepID=UPI0012F6A1E4|nr:hypothetical protein [Massilia sp. Root418]